MCLVNPLTSEFVIKQRDNKTMKGKYFFYLTCLFLFLIFTVRFLPSFTKSSLAVNDIRVNNHSTLTIVQDLGLSSTEQKILMTQYKLSSTQLTAVIQIIEQKIVKIIPLLNSEFDKLHNENYQLTKLVLNYQNKERDYQTNKEAALIAKVMEKLNKKINLNSKIETKKKSTKISNKRNFNSTTSWQDQSTKELKITNESPAQKVARILFPNDNPLTRNKNLEFIIQSFHQLNLDDLHFFAACLAFIKVECAGHLEPKTEPISSYNTPPNGQPYSLYDFRKDLGNNARGDGNRYKGRGFVQLTGLNNYSFYSKLLNLGDELINNPDNANDPEIAAKIFAQFVKRHEIPLRNALKENDYPTFRRLINGGTHGSDEFQKSLTNTELQMQLKY
jgi:hypothetical protein